MSDALREERNELSRDYRKLASEADELRRQRDEALQALRELLDNPNGELSTRHAVDILAQYDKDGEV